MANVDPNGPQMRFASFPPPDAPDYGFDKMFDLNSTHGFMIDQYDGWRQFWLKIDLGHPKLVICHTMYICTTKYGRTCITDYTFGHSLGDINSTTFSPWYEPEHRFDYLLALRRSDKDVVTNWLEPQWVRTLELTPLGRHRRVCWRHTLLFCSGMSHLHTSRLYFSIRS